MYYNKQIILLTVSRIENMAIMCNRSKIKILLVCTSGERIGWSFWRKGQGQSEHGFLFSSGEWEDCAQIRLIDGYKWHDYPCNGFLSHYSCICEYSKYF